MLKKSADYALIMHHAVRHVGLELEGAAPAALSFADLTKRYEHPNPADLSRVKRHEGAEDDRAAISWIIRYAVNLLNGGLTVDGDRVSFAPGKNFDDLFWAGGKVERPEPNPDKLGDPFSPISGIFSDNIREELGDMTELRESMKAWGWIAEFPALVDERGVVLVGNRRMKIAKELGLTPVVKELRLGFGDAADVERFKLAIASNIGGKKLSPNDRKRIAAHLYSEQEWSQEKIAEALNVAQITISTDLRELKVPVNSKRGRPRKEKAKNDPVKAAEERRTVTPEQEAIIDKLFDEGKSRANIAEQTGLGEKAVQLAQQRHLGRVEERQRLMNERLKAEVVSHLCTCPVCGHRHQPLDAENRMGREDGA